METPEQPTTPVPEKKVKSTFMLHCPDTLKALAKLSSSDYRYAALKVSSRSDKLPDNLKNDDGSLRIFLRKTNTKLLREYKGSVITLDTPTEIVRSGRTIRYTKKPHVKFIGKHMWDDIKKSNASPQDDAPDLA